jgi:hypothetical protein
MTSRAGRRLADVLLLQSACVTGLTRHSSVSPHERKIRLLMLLDHVSDLPGLCVMTSQTIGAKLRTVNVRMAGRALSAQLRKPQPLVAGRTCDSLVPPSERKPLVCKNRVLLHLP